MIVISQRVTKLTMQAKIQHPLITLLKEHELWLMRRVRDYAMERDYTRYTSTLEEAWRVSIVGLTDSIAAAMDISEEPWELGPDDNFISDPVAAFGVFEAQKHRSRGITLEMFMGLMKYYRQAYLDLIDISFPIVQDEDCTDRDRFARFVERVFDRIEIAFCAEWSRKETVNSAVDVLQTANRQITNEKNKFLTIFESLPIAVFVLDDQGHIVHMNQAGAQLIDQSATSGGHYYSCPEERLPFPWLADELSMFRRSGDEMQSEYRIVPATGNECWVLARFRLVQDISFKFAGTLVIFEDITERKMAEEMRMRMGKLESIGILAAGIAHDFNNMLSVIVNNVWLAKKRLNKESLAYQDLEEAEESMQQAIELCNRFLTFSKGGEPFRRLASVSRIVEESSAILADYQDIVFKEEIADGLLPVMVDERQIVLAMRSLFLNALEAMPSGGTITVAAKNLDLAAINSLNLGAGKYVEIAVADQGVGIPVANQSKIFDPYYSTKDFCSQKGLGMGLAICHSLIRKHGGHIFVESEPGKGTTMRLYLPTV